MKAVESARSPSELRRVASPSAERVVRMLHRAVESDGAFALGPGGLRLEHVEGRAPSRDLVARVAASGASASPSSIELWIDGNVESSLFAFTGYGAIVHVGLWCRGERAWSSRERALVADVASVVADLPDPGQSRDHLTGLLDRSGFLHAIAQRVTAHGALLFVDLDGLKVLNDQHGHAAGDEAIRIAASVIADAVGPVGLAARWGGDELVAWASSSLAPSTLVERIRDELQQRPVAGTILDASIGVAVVHPGEPIEEALVRADDAMYRRKRQKHRGRAEARTSHRKSR